MTESVFSMDGDLADLPALVRLKERYGATLIVDEAHAVGVFGELGRGLAEAAGVLDEVDILVGTFGKALASVGAFAVTSPPLKEYFVNTVRPFIFTTALPPAVLSWSRLTLRRMQGMGRERTELAALGRRLRDELAARGCVTGGDSQIVPVIVGEDEAAVRLAPAAAGGGVPRAADPPPDGPPGDGAGAAVPDGRAALGRSARAAGGGRRVGSVRLHWQVREGHPRLLLFFNGWGMDERLLGMIEPPAGGICWRSATTRTCRGRTRCGRPSRTTRRRTSWPGRWGSGPRRRVFGAGGGALWHRRWPSTGRAGRSTTSTGYRRISSSATLDGFSERARDSFFRRMCDGRDACGEFLPHAPLRDVEDQRRELLALARDAARVCRRPGRSRAPLSARATASCRRRTSCATGRG